MRTMKKLLATDSLDNRMGILLRSFCILHSAFYIPVL